MTAASVGRSRHVIMRIPIALLVLLCFGCATVRVPAGSVDGPPPDLGEVADPRVELWLEGGSAASPSETAQAQKAARDALAIAMSQRRPDVSALDAEDPVVVVRERAVTRTPARKREQVAARVGMVVGVVAVAAAALFVAITSKGGGSKIAPAAKSAPASAAPAKAAPAVAAAAKPGTAKPPARPRARPVARPASAAPQAAGGGKPTPARPGFAPGPPPPMWYPASRPGGFIYWETAISFHAPVPFDPDVAPDPDAPLPPAPPPDEMAAEPAPPLPPLPPMDKLPLDQRGFFDGDLTVLEVDVVDRATGTVLWTRRVKSGADPRDRGDVQRLLDEALADLPR